MSAPDDRRPAARAAILGSNVNQLCISASGETFSMLAISCFCSLSITAVCIGCTSGSPINCRASRGVQSISTFTFMIAPDAIFDGSSQYRRDRPQDASDLTGRSRILCLHSAEMVS